MLLLLAAEGVLRFIVGLGDPPLYITDPRFEYAGKPGEYHRFGNVITYNRWHMRSKDVEQSKPAGERRVLILGDSIVNGGSPTGDADLATTLLEPRLSKAWNAPTRVLNISCGSWGPRNLLEYLKAFGTFDADTAVLVLNSIDYGDEPTFAPLTSEQPTTRPLLALQEAISNYLPRAIAKITGSAGPAEDDANPPPDRGEKSLAALRELVALLRSKGIKVSVVQHLRRDEVEGAPFIGHAKIGAVLIELNLPVLQSADWFKPHYNDPVPVLRDAAHPNSAGQKILADVLEKAITAAK